MLDILYAKSVILNVVMLSVVMLSVVMPNDIMLSVVMLYVIMLNVVAQQEQSIYNGTYGFGQYVFKVYRLKNIWTVTRI